MVLVHLDIDNDVIIEKKQIIVIQVGYYKIRCTVCCLFLQVINGELTPSFRHKGFRPTLDKVSTTLSLQEYQTSGKKSWVQEATQVLEQVG